MAVQRFLRMDAGFPANIQRTPQGGARFKARLTRTGVLVYRTPDGSEIREYRPESEVSDPESLATLRGSTITREHPGIVTPENFAVFNRGHVADDSIQFVAPYVDGDMVVQDANLLDDIEQGIRREVSCGYQCEVDPTPGVSPEGEPYDRIQRRIRYNHVAVVEKGRAGSEVSLRLDGAGNELVDSDGAPNARKEYDPMKSIRIDGVEYPLNTDAEIQAARNAWERYQTRLDSESRQREADRGVLLARAETAEKRADAAETLVKTLRADLEKSRKFDAEDMDVLSKAKAIMGGDYNPEGKTPDEVMKDCVAKSFPQKDISNASPDYIRGLFEAIETPAEEAAETNTDAGSGGMDDPNATDPGAGSATTEKKADSLARVNSATAPTPRTVQTPTKVTDPRAAMMSHNRDRGRAPLRPRS